MWLTQTHAEMLIALSKQLVGYSTSGYVRVFISPEGASLVEQHDKAFDSLMYAKDPAAWKEHLGADGSLVRFLESGAELPTADWISAEELATHNRILKGGYAGVFNWYKAAVFCDPPEEHKRLTAEDKAVEVPALFIATERDYAVIKDMHVQMTRSVAKDLTVETLDTGHWAMLEAKEEVGRLLEDFARTRCS